MASGSARTQHYTAFQREGGGDGESRLGVISIDPNGVMTVEEQTADETLAGIVERMNGKPTMFLEVPSAPDAPRYTLTNTVVRRGDPDFVPALKDYLKKYYGVELRPH